MIYLRPGHKEPTTPTAAGGTSGQGPSLLAKPKAVAADYRLTPSEFTSGVVFDQDAIDLHLKYPISILNMSPTQAQAGQPGYLFVQKLTDPAFGGDPNHLVGQYTIASQQHSDVTTGGSLKAPIYNGLNAGGTDGKDYWARDRGTANNGTNGKMKSPIAINFDSWEVNLCSTRVANADGNRAAEIIADGYSDTPTGIYYPLFTVGCKMLFQDNVWGNPGNMTPPSWQSKRENGTLLTGSCGDFNMDNVNDPYDHGWTLRNTAVNIAYRQGQANYAIRCKTNLPGLSMCANADYDFINDATFGNSCLMNPEFKVGGVPVYRFAFIEGATSNAGNDGASITAYRSSFLDMLNRVYTTADNVTEGVFMNSYVQSSLDGQARTLQKARFCLGLSLFLPNSWAAVSDRVDGTRTMRPYWFNELDQPIGTMVDSRPTGPAAGWDGLYKVAYTNALVVLNPSQNKGRWMGNGPVTQLSRTSNVVSLTMPTTSLSGITIVNGTTRIRIQDCVDSTFNGVFIVSGTVVSGSNTTINWSQTAANTTNVRASNTPNSSATNLYGYWGFQTTVDFTALGLTGQYKRILGTDDSHDNYNGTVGANVKGQTSQNDGTVVTTLTLWPADAIILLKV